MSQPQSTTAPRFTWTDYQTWPSDQRWEIVGGEAYAMSPAPSTRHQKLLMRLAANLEHFFAGRPCEVYPAPTDVKLSETDVVQPDLVVVCDPTHVHPTHIEGPPALVIEILSPSTEHLDRGRKLDLYAASGVQEVWLISPWPALMELFVLDGGAYRRLHAFTQTDPFQSPSFPELTCDLATLFDLPITPEEEQLRIVREAPPTFG
jgi:Uma2 family endonuclease